MKISDIPKNLQIKRPPIFKNKGGLRILGAGSMKRRIKVFRPIRPGAKHGHGNKKNRNQSSDILQHSQNRPTGDRDRWLKF